MVALPLGALAGWLISVPTKRLKQDYWALATLGAAEVFRLLMQNERWIANGSIGIRGITPILPEPWQLALLMLGLVAVVLGVNERIRRSPLGRALRVIREDETMAAALGRDIYWYQVRVMMLGGAIAALAGVVYGHYYSYVNPDAFMPIETFLIWTGVILGGRGNNFGVLAGAAVLDLMSSSTRFLATWSGLHPEVVANLRVMIQGLILVLLVLFRPQGLFPERKRVYRLDQPGPSVSPRPAREPSSAS
jgi:branched-chain amino acid transport system permease protein